MSQLYHNLSYLGWDPLRRNTEPSIPANPSLNSILISLRIATLFAQKRCRGPPNLGLAHWLKDGTSWVRLREPVIQANGRLIFEDDLRSGAGSARLHYTVNQRPHWACQQYGDP